MWTRKTKNQYGEIERVSMESKDDDIPVKICSNWRTCPVFKMDYEENFSGEDFAECIKWNENYVEKLKLVGKTYEDPEGSWIITDVDTIRDIVTIKQLQDENVYCGKEYTVTLDEATYYLNGSE